MSQRDVVVIGGGAAGPSGALVLARARRDVLVVAAGEPRNAPAARMHGFLSRDGLPPGERLALGRAEVKRYIEGTIEQLVIDDDTLRGVQMDDGCVVPRDALFVPPRFVPNNQLVANLGCHVDDDGWVTTDGTGRTSVPGVWAAGNLVDPRAQVITAAGAGSAAAIALNADLTEDDVRDAVSALNHGSSS
jgi:thioredoxin reductase